MAKKSSASSQPARLKNMKSEDIRNRDWTESERRAIRKIARQQEREVDPASVPGDIPKLTRQQLSAMVRLRAIRPPKVAVSVRLDANVLDWLKSKGEGHLTRVNDILANLMEAETQKRLRR